MARQKLASQLLDFKIKLYLLDAGDPPTLMEELGPSLGFVGYAATLDPAISPDDPRPRIIRGAIAACNQAIAAGKWSPELAPAIAHGLTVAEELNKVLSPQAVNAAEKHLSQI